MNCLKQTDEQFVDEEYSIASQLKAVCFENGKEKNPRQSADLLRQMALVYMRRSPDKMSLLRSCALFNAALNRKPENTNEVLRGLEKLCEHILALAGAVKKETAKLLEKSEELKLKVKEMREKTKMSLQCVNIIPEDVASEQLLELEKLKISQVQKIQHDVTHEYASLMDEISRYCSDVMGPPPCKFALVGMGSLARKEITPYSDFENVIVLEEGVQRQDNYEEIKIYFRWFAVAFQLMLINFGETVLRFVTIPSLNDATKPNGDWFYDAVTSCGISPDGFAPHASKNPLGRQELTENKRFKTELIQPVSLMVKYLDTDEDLKNGYHLADILTKTCFVSGDSEVYENFAEAVRKKEADLRENGPDFFQQIVKQVEKNARNFATWNNLEHMHKNVASNIKSIIYRSGTIFISALGRLYSVNQPSCFEIIEQLALKGLLSIEDQHRLMYATALACEVRLKVYMKKGSQDDWVKKTESDEGVTVNELIQTIGEPSIASYFEISHSLQEAMSEHIERGAVGPIILPRIHFSKSGAFYFLKLYRKSIDAIKREIREISTTFGEFPPATMVYCKYRLGYALIGLKRYDEAAAEFREALSIQMQEEKKENSKKVEKIPVFPLNCLKIKRSQPVVNVATANLSASRNKVAINNYGVCLLRLKHFDDAMACFRQALIMAKQEAEICGDGSKDRLVALFTYNVGRCHFELGEMSEALERFETSLEIRKRISRNERKDKEVAMSLYQAGKCLIRLNKPNRALQLVEEALLINSTASSDVTCDPDVADNLNQAGLCLYKLARYEDAFSYFEREREIRNSISEAGNTDDTIVDCVFYAGCCLFKLKRNAEAASYFVTSEK